MVKYIYVIGNETAIKIGFSTDPQERLKQLQTANEQPLTLLWSMERADAAQLEKHLHRKFKKHKLLGEWFNRSAINIQTIINESYTFTKYDW